MSPEDRLKLKEWEGANVSLLSYVNHHHQAQLMFWRKEGRTQLVVRCLGVVHLDLPTDWSDAKLAFEESPEGMLTISDRAASVTIRCAKAFIMR